LIFSASFGGRSLVPKLIILARGSRILIGFMDNAAVTSLCFINVRWAGF